MLQVIPAPDIYMEASIKRNTTVVPIHEMTRNDRRTGAADAKRYVTQTYLKIVEIVDFCEEAWNGGSDVVECSVN